MRAFLVRLPSSVRYWTVVDDGYRVVRVADEYLQHLRLGRDAAGGTTKSYAEALPLYLRWGEQGSRGGTDSARAGACLSMSAAGRPAFSMLPGRVTACQRRRRRSTGPATLRCWAC